MRACTRRRPSVAKASSISSGLPTATGWSSIAERVGGGLDGLEGRPVDRVARVPEDADARRVRDGLLEEIEVLHPELEPLVGPACDVASRARKARDEPARDRIGDAADDDGDRGGGALGCQCRRRARREDHVDREPGELGRQLGKPLVLAISGADLEDEVPALDPAEVAEPVPEGLVERRVRGRAGLQVPDPRHPRRRLGARVGGAARSARNAVARRASLTPMWPRRRGA